MRKQRLRESQQYRGRRIAASVLIMAVISAIIIALFYNLYDGAKQSILNIWENNVIQLAKSTEYYLARPADAIEFSAAQVESMIAQGKTNAEIGAYLVREKDNYASLIENNFTGVYGYCRGEYMDASGWEPEAGYDPTQRPWYTAALANGGQVTLVAPFLNLQTREMMMSVSKLLGDGESVLSMDIYMDSLQKTVDDLAREESVKVAFIIDSEGRVVVHSLRGEAGNNYRTDDSDYHRGLFARVQAISQRENYYEEGEDGSEIIFAEKVDGAWCAVLILSESRVLGSLRYLNVVLMVLLTLALGVWHGVSVRVDRKYREAEQLSREVSAVADIYDAMTLVDLRTDRMTVLRSSEDLERVLEGDLNGYSRRIAGMAERMAAEESRDMLARFMDPATYEERLTDARSISFDFLSDQGRWLRIQLIVVDRDAKGRLKHIIWAIESIDRERRQQERLRRLAETDALSGLRNRRSGEARTRAHLAADAPGVFILLDIDRFKSINDQFGHIVGDLVITAVADCLRRTFREGDTVFRLGGDEFAVFMPGADDPAVGQRCVRRLAQEISRVTIPEMAGSPVTVSAGIACYTPGSGESFESLYQRADQLMYESKRKKH